MTRDLGAVLRWITGLLEDLGIEYQVVGGLAARCYGSNRALVDIDLYAPDEASLDRIASAAADRVARPPTPHLDEHWDLTFLALAWREWKVEIAAADTAKVWDRRVGHWASSAIRFGASQVVTVSGVDLPVMPRADLIRYKQGLGREVDRMDLAAIQDRQVAPHSEEDS